jgi:hypothetical protein
MGARKTGTTTELGYGWNHQRARAQAVRDMEDGQPCVRCGGPLYRSMGKRLHLDHHDDRRGYRGLAHGRCNEQAGQAKAQRQRKPKRNAPSATPHSRNW